MGWETKTSVPKEPCVIPECSSHLTGSHPARCLSALLLGSTDFNP